MRAYIDTDVLVWHLRGEKKANRLLKRLRDLEGYELWTGVMQRGEVLFHMRPEEEDATVAFMSLINTSPVNQEIIDRAAAIFREWHPSAGVDENDAILAATALLTGGQVFTQNVKHYPMQGLVVKKGW